MGPRALGCGAAGFTRLLAALGPVGGAGPATAPPRRIGSGEERGTVGVPVGHAVDGDEERVVRHGVAVAGVRAVLEQDAGAVVDQQVVVDHVVGHAVQGDAESEVAHVGRAVAPVPIWS